jgi:hypothetical protein
MISFKAPPTAIKRNREVVAFNPKPSNMSAIP